MIRMMQPVLLSFSRLSTVPSNHSFAVVLLASESASSGFNGSSIKMKSAPRPVIGPPTEVEIRTPPRFVSKSFTAALRRDRRVWKTPWWSFTPHQLAAVPGVLVCQLLRIAGYDDLGCRPLSSSQATKAIETQCDFRDCGGTLMISRLVRP